MFEKSTNFLETIPISTVKFISILYLLITILFYLFKINQDYRGSDYSNYTQGANSIFTSLPYSTHGNPNIADNFRPPGYPFIIAVSKKISNTYFNEIVIITQIFLFTAIYIFFLKILVFFEIYTKSSILLSSFLFSHPVMIFTTTQVQTDLFLSFFVSLFIYLFILFSIKKQIQYLYFAVLSISISIYFRPTYIYYVPILLIIVGLIYGYKRSFFALLIYVLIISPWLIRNMIVLNSNSFSDLGKIALSYHAAETLRISENISINEAHEKLREEAKIPLDYSKIKNDPISMNRFTNYSISKIKQNPISYFIANLRGLARVFIIPHGIFIIKKDTTLNVHDFIITLKTNPKNLIKELNLYFLYLYILPYIINLILFIGLLGYLIKSKILLRENRSIYFVFMSLFIYGLLIPGPLNKSQYIMSYYTIIVGFCVFFYQRMLTTVTKKSIQDGY